MRVRYRFFTPSGRKKQAAVAQDELPLRERLGPIAVFWLRHVVAFVWIAVLLYQTVCTLVEVCAVACVLNGKILMARGGFSSCAIE